MKITTIFGATPLDEDAIRGLLPRLTTQQELNEYEAQNISAALRWAQSSRILKKSLLSATGLCTLHKKMFGDTWKWAGEFRMRQTNIGVAPENIQNDLGILLGDAKYWLANKVFDIEEIGIRFHHRLVKIHPFTNGNGRHARFAANLLVQFNGGKIFTWGSEDLLKDSQARSRYIKALQLADINGEYHALLEFAKS